jgi:histidinol-phosphate aminotransferase
VTVAGGVSAAVPLRPEGACDADALLAAIDARTKLVFCATVNNPTGGLMAADDLARLARDVPASVLLAVDDAYFEYARQAGGHDALDALRGRTGPWLLMRTFSKAYALAGLRVAYGFMNDPAMVDAYVNLKAMFNVTSVAQAAAAAAWRETGWRDAMLATCAAQRARLSTGLAALGCAPFPSVANYVTARIGRPAGPVAGALLARGVIAGALHDPGFEDCLRISTGTEADTDAFLAAMREILAP